MKQGTEIISWEDLCEAAGLDPVKELAQFDALDPKIKKRHIGLHKIETASNHYWRDEKSDLTDPNQEKWFNVFNGRNDSGFGFSYSLTYYDYADADVGAPLSFPSEEIANHVAGIGLEWYRDFMVS
jgi:hypothetical protein